MELRSARSTRYLPVVLMLVVGLALVGLMVLAAPATQASPAMVPMGTPTITPTPGVNYLADGPCVNFYQSGATCTANDVTIASLEPNLSEVCLPGNDTATVRFTANIVGGSQARYDIGLFIAQDGGSALTGTQCYHDFLQPNTTGTDYDLLSGYGPFKELESVNNADRCGDVQQNELNKYRTQVGVTVACVDNNLDGVVDPISTCLSWDNNQGGTCNNVTNAIPGTPSKCRCEPIGSGIIIYRGLDYGDLPDSPYQTLNPNGAYHAVQDADNNGTPDTIGGITAVWLGARIDMETNGQPNAAATGDDLAGGPDDEDGIVTTPGFQWSVAGGGSVDVTVSRSDGNACTQANPCKLAIYVDWDGNGSFSAGEQTIQDVFFGTQSVTFLTSGISVLPPNVYARFRLYRVAPQSPSVYSPSDLVLNGEVEDYLFDLVPLGVTLSDFSAMCTAGQPEIHWETVSELNTLGFNVWRNTSSSGPQDKLNDAMIPAHPGSAQGYAYAFTDTTAVAGTTYYYWLEDISTGNVSSFTGPIEIQCQIPTSVGLDTVDANPAAGAALPVAGLLAVGAAGAAAVWLRRRRA